MYYWLFHPFVACALGAFATAYMHEHTGRDPRTGGLIGAAVGFFCGYPFLVSLWVWLYHNRLNVHIINRRRRWFEWWRP
jgi:hypothetical protein